MENCLTNPMLLKKVSGCLVEKPKCGFAHKFGFSFVCRHPEHAKFHAHKTGALTAEEALERYNTLRQKRRDEFVASQKKTSIKYS